MRHTWSTCTRVKGEGFSDDGLSLSYTYTPELKERHAGRQAGRQACRHAGMQAGRHAGRQAGRQ